MNYSSNNDLPKGWIWTTLEEVTTPKVIQAPPAGEGEFIYIDISSIDNHSKKIVSPKVLPVSQTPNRARQRIQPGDVLVSMTRPNLNALALVPENLEGAIGSTGFYVLRSNYIMPEWLFYLVQSNAFISAMTSLVQDVLYPAVRPKDVIAFPIPFAPLPEQHRIVAEIETQFTRLDVSVAALQRVQTNLKRYRASVLQAACAGRLVPTEAKLARAEGRTYESADQLLQRILQERRAKWECEQLANMKAASKTHEDDRWKSKYREPGKPDTSELPELPEGWMWASLSQIAQVERGKFQHRPRNDPRFYDGPYPFVQIGDLPREGGLITEFKQSLNEDGLRISRLFKSETILIAIVGATIANTGVLSFDACAPDSLVAIRGYLHQMTPFIDLYLRERKHHIRSQSYASGGQPNINLELLNPFPVPLPPLEEQCRIISEVQRRLSVIDELESVIATNLKRAGRLRQAILKRAFEGKLVPQDPTDEPAHVLLERIRIERERTTEKPKAAPQQTNAPQPIIQLKATAPVQGELALGLRG